MKDFEVKFREKEGRNYIVQIFVGGEREGFRGEKH